MTALADRLPAAPRTLTARLVAVVVLLVAVTAAVIGTATTLVMRDYFTDRLDDEVRGSLFRGFGPPVDVGPGPRGDDRGPGGQRIGTLTALLPSATGVPTGFVVEDASRGGVDELPVSAEVLDRLEDLPADGRVREVDLPGLGTYRVVAAGDGNVTAVAGLPTDEVDETLTWLVTIVVVVGAGAVLLAGAAGTVVVRRQLAPLREVAATAHRVAELPLASGEIEMTERVPARLTDERTEVGQVGSALNAMLDHVEDSLGRRHRSEQQVRQFVADASHELRTPLATIAGYTELARHRPETSGTALDKVETESARMTTLVEDLLLLARLDSGRPLERRPVDLSRLLLEAVDDARVVDPDRSWRLSLPDEPLTVTGDEARLHQVVSNLLTNARTHTPPGSTVTVTGTADGFTVHDDGPGFTPDLAPHAFERFTRGDAARTRGGAGLGLSLVEAIVGAHGGVVTLDSRPGDTTISVVLPSPAA
ncbi:MAG TPA: HAMP domain-containing sensor histidine kinase [Nocardioides sp.]|nr:HAMP domain-containing sensor histidine kinase [Nocardioides sp.]